MSLFRRQRQIDSEPEPELRRVVVKIPMICVRFQLVGKDYSTTIEFPSDDLPGSEWMGIIAAELERGKVCLTDTRGNQHLFFQNQVQAVGVKEYTAYVERLVPEEDEDD